MAKLFTIEEANALLPRLRKLLKAMFALRDEAMAIRPDIMPVLEKAANNGGSRQAGELFLIFNKFEKLLKELHGFECELKGFEQGLIDFPSLRDGRKVYLCWQYDEPEVAYWHEIDGGFAGRQSL
ncbi:MAG TPA: DUF2203 domain-containing protein [Anaerolineae bacterium]